MSGAAAAVASLPSAERFKPYPAYKDSGVEWLGEIPAHWEAKWLKFAAVLNPSASETRPPPPTTEVSFVPMEAVGEYGGLDLSRTRALADAETGYTYFRDGDVVVAKITPCFENGKGARATGLTNGVAFGTTELHLLRATPALDGTFLFYLTLSDAFRRLGEAEMYGAGGEKRVPESFIGNFRHALPPVSEQRTIAAFLDRETRTTGGCLIRSWWSPIAGCWHWTSRPRTSDRCRRPYGRSSEGGTGSRLRRSRTSSPQIARTTTPANSARAAWSHWNRPGLSRWPRAPDGRRGPIRLGRSSA